MADIEKETEKPKIVFKRHGHDAHAHHGGAWKIAYADFVTAMMAFFLLMWLLSSAGKYELQGISEQFNRPISSVFSDSGSASSVLQGGGTDATRNKGDIRHGDPQDPKNRLKAGKMTQTKESQEEEKKLRQVAQELKKAIETNPEVKKLADQIKIDFTTEGLRIQLVDKQNRPMFSSGSAELQSYTKELISEVSKIVRQMPNTIALSGHTDSTPYPGSGKGYSNWELSSDRANAARRELMSNGVAMQRFRRVTGLADSSPISPDLRDPENRRITIVLMTTEADRKLQEASLPAVDVTKEQLPPEAQEAGTTTKK
jgi:chemotaxis protein MotB